MTRFVFILSFLLSVNASAGILDKLFSRIPKPSPSDPQVVINGLSPQKQEQKMWCWAAIARMMMSSKTSHLPSQCEIVSQTRGEDCCHHQSAKCLEPFYPERALEKFGFNYKTELPKSYPEKHWAQRVDNKGWYGSVIDHVRNGTPVGIIRLNNVDSQAISSHMVLAYGTYNKDGKDYLVIFDPFEGITKFWDETYVTGFLAWVNTLVID